MAFAKLLVFLAVEPMLLSFSSHRPCALHARVKHYAERHVTFISHQREHTQDLTKVGHILFFKNKSFSLLLAVLNVQFCPTVGSKVLEANDYKYKNRGQQSTNIQIFHFHRT